VQVELFLTRILLNTSAFVFQEIEDAYKLHQRVLSLFPVGTTASQRILYRFDAEPRQIIIQSQTPPMLDRLPKDYALPLMDCPVNTLLNPHSKKFRATFKRGGIYRFRLRANPTIKKGGKRIPITAETDNTNWLHRKSELGGFSVFSVDSLVRESVITGIRGRNKITFNSTLFEGLLMVSDVKKFTSTFLGGLGGGKSFGFGMLSLTLP